MPFTHHLPWLFYCSKVSLLIQVTKLLIVHYSSAPCQFLPVSYQYPPRNTAINHRHVYTSESRVRDNTLSPRQTSCKVTVIMLTFLRRGGKMNDCELEGKSNIMLCEVASKVIIISETESTDPLPHQECRAMRYECCGTEVHRNWLLVSGWEVANAWRKIEIKYYALVPLSPGLCGAVRITRKSGTTRGNSVV
jgi:hypothetical protein